MDGGGRLLRSLSEALRASAPLAQPAYAGVERRRRRVLLRGERSRAACSPGRDRLRRPAPRGVGAGSGARADLRRSTRFGAVRGGQYAAFVAERRAASRDFVARAFGFDIAIVTISGASRTARAGNSRRRRHQPEEFAAVPRRRRRPAPRLEAAPLVKQASVRKLYPDHLVIDLVERAPYALWQKDGQVNIVAADGAVIDADARSALRQSALRGRRGRQRAPAGIHRACRRPPANSARRSGRACSSAERRWNLKMTNPASTSCCRKSIRRPRWRRSSACSANRASSIATSSRSICASRGACSPG